MQYFFIYSGGGGAGDWNGLNRVWRQSMPFTLKQNVLLKFGDIFINHTPKKQTDRLIKPVLARTITNLRQWLFNRTNDEFVQNNTVILLDSGTSKIVNHINALNPNYSEAEFVSKFVELVEQNNLLERYAQIILDSNINEAVTFDMPNPFKVRTQSVNTRTNIFTAASNHLHIRQSAVYSNQLYALLGNSQQRILTALNGLWSIDEINEFVGLLNYNPVRLAIGGLTRASDANFRVAIENINTVFDIQNLERVHFLGCGGRKRAQIIKALGYNFNHVSVDCSTPINRSFEGNNKGTKPSAYVDYINLRDNRITPDSLETILNLHLQFPTPLFTQEQMREILEGILEHQGGNSDYENRAKLYIHNSDVLRVNAL